MAWLSYSYRLSSGGLTVVTLREERVLCLRFQNCYFNQTFKGYFFFPLISRLHLLLVHLVIFNLHLWFSLVLTHAAKRCFYLLCTLGLQYLPCPPWSSPNFSVGFLSSLVYCKCCVDTSLSDNLISYSALFGSQTEGCCVRGLHGRWGTSAGKAFLSVHTSNCYGPVTVANLPW